MSDILKSHLSIQIVREFFPLLPHQIYRIPYNILVLQVVFTKGWSNYPLPLLYLLSIINKEMAAKRYDTIHPKCKIVIMDDNEHRIQVSVHWKAYFFYFTPETPPQSFWISNSPYFF